PLIAPGVRTLFGQIADGEPDGSRYTYRLNGVLVQPYWSASRQAFIVPDGSDTDFVLTPYWSGKGSNATFNRTYTLSVHGAALGYGTDDTFLIDQDVDSHFGVHLRVTHTHTRNGTSVTSTAEFEPNSIALNGLTNTPGVTLDGGTGKNVIDVAALTA